MPLPRPARQSRRLTESVIRHVWVEVPDVEDEEEDVLVAAPAASIPRRELPAINVMNPELLDNLSCHPLINLHVNEVKAVFDLPFSY